MSKKQKGAFSGSLFIKLLLFGFPFDKYTLRIPIPVHEWIVHDCMINVIPKFIFPIRQPDGQDIHESVLHYAKTIDPSGMFSSFGVFIHGVASNTTGFHHVIQAILGMTNRTMMSMAADDVAMFFFQDF